MKLNELKKEHLKLSKSNRNSLDLLLPYANNILTRMTSDELWEFIESTVNMKKEKLENTLLIRNTKKLTISNTKTLSEIKPKTHRKLEEAILEVFSIEGENTMPKNKLLMGLSEVLNLNPTRIYALMSKYEGDIFYEERQGRSKTVILNVDDALPIKENEYVVWQCSPSSDTRGKKTNYRFCNKWFVRRTQSFTNGKNPNSIQMSCPECSNRPRKNRRNILLFNNKQQAIEMCNLKNEE